MCTTMKANFWGPPLVLETKRNVESFKRFQEPILTIKYNSIR